MVQRIDLTDGRVFRILKNNNLMIEESQHSITNQSRRRHEEWMFHNDIPDEWSNDNVRVDVRVADQPYERGYPILAPIERIEDEEHPDGVFRFPHNWEMRTQQIEKSIEKQGTDALAWYRPFHMAPQEKWGITILDQGIWYVARKLAEEMYSEPYDENQIQLCRNIAKNFLYHHEMFHFKVELAATMVELINSRPIYAQYWSPQEHREWFGSEVKSHGLGKAPLEEALANSYAWDKIYSEYEEDDRKVVKNAIKEFIKTQPDGYNHGFRLTVGGENWKEAMSELINKLLNATDEDDLFSPHRTLLSHLFFNGGQGKEDCIEEYYEGIVPCIIIDTGFARGLFSKSGRRETPSLGAFCMTKRCAKEYEGAPRGIQLDLITAVTQDWLESEGTFSLQSKQRRQYKAVSKGAKWNSNPKRVREFRLFSDNNQDSWRAYEEKYHPTDERILRKMHRKAAKNKQSNEIKKLKKGIDPDKIGPHNIQCNYK